MSNDLLTEYSLNPNSISAFTGVNVSEGMARNLVNNAMRQFASTVRANVAANAGTITSASTLTLASISTGDYIFLTPSGGSSSITSFGTATAGLSKRLEALGTVILRNDSSKLNLPSASDLTISTGDVIYARALSDTSWKVIHFPNNGIPQSIVNASSITASDTSSVLVLSSGTIAKVDASSLASDPLPIASRRQTVMSGPVTSDGLPNFGGSTGSGTVTMTGTLIATAANGFSSTGNTDRIGSITDASWTGLTTDGTMYLYLDLAADGTATTGSGTLAPIYQFGGTPSTTSGQFTFNISQMTAYVGNGSAAPATYRVYVGQVTVASNVVTVITWYALNGKYIAPWTATLFNASTTASFSHNLGVIPFTSPLFEVENTTTDQGYAVGERTYDMYTFDSVTIVRPPFASTATVSRTINSASDWRVRNISTGALATVTKASWKYRAIVDRGF